MTTFLTRDQWGCSQATEDWIAGRRVRTKAEKTEVHIHHTAGVDGDDFTPNRWDLSEATAYMRRLETLRPDLGPLPYSENLAVLENLEVVFLEGRGLLVSGAHTGGHNTQGIGWGVLGNFDRTDTDAVDAIISALNRRLADLRHNQGFTVLGDTSNPRGWEVWGHRDSKSTACPGATLYPRLADIRFKERNVAIPDYARPAVAKAVAGGFAKADRMEDLVPRYDLMVWLDRLGALDDFNVEESGEVRRVNDRVSALAVRVEALEANPPSTVDSIARAAAKDAATVAGKAADKATAAKTEVASIRAHLHAT